MAQRIYISDTNIWIDFGRAGLLDALFALPFTFVSTDFVVNELSHPDPVALRSLGLVVQNLNEVEVQSLFGPPAATQTAPLMATQTAPPGRGELTH